MGRYLRRRWARYSFLFGIIDQTKILKGAVVEMLVSRRWVQTTFFAFLSIGLGVLLTGMFASAGGHGDEAFWELLAGTGCWIIAALILGFFWPHT